ncbi:MAG: hypothetical protein PSN34_14585 [Urechidicola sp.]|nr:hypothetical protein [Urechidicola sp.]
MKEITIIIKKSDEQIYYPIFYDTELEKVSDIQLFVKKGKKFKQVAIKNIHEEDVELDYITSKKIKSVKIPLDFETKLTYTVKCNELMYFSSLHFFSNNRIDLLKYQVIVPEKFEFIHNTIYKDSLSLYAIDSSKIANNSTQWNIKVVPKKSRARSVAILWNL